MTLRYLIAASVGIALITGAAAKADIGYTPVAYKPGDYLLLDLQKAVLSPNLLGPSAQFEPYPVEARADAKNELDAAADKPRSAVRKAVPVARPKRAAATRQQPPARSRVARTRSNPLDANAADTRVQVWPCRSGGICNWQK